MIAVGLSRPNYFEPGTNWGYSHTNYVILGKLLSKITGKLDVRRSLRIRPESHGPEQHQ